MHHEILNNNQLDLLPLMAQFRREYYLVGGTAIALYLRHRRSIDFDLFKFGSINHKRNLDKINKAGYSPLVTRRVAEQMNLIANDVKITFFQYPFNISPQTNIDKVFRIPSLLQLAAMKAYALGRRSKWKDYVDLFFLLNQHFSLEEIAIEARTIFGDLFSEKLFRGQLCYFEDIDYTEDVEYLISNPPTNSEIQEKLTSIATQNL